MTPYHSAGVLLALLLASCVNAPVALESHNLRLPAATARVADCHLPPFRLEDRRPRSDLGVLYGHEMTYPHLLEWVEAALHASAPIDASAPAVLLELLRAYIQSHPSGHTFQVVLRARDGHAGSRARIYRGMDSGITWRGTKNEFGRSVEVATRNALAALTRSEGRCVAAIQ